MDLAQDSSSLEKKSVQYNSSANKCANELKLYSPSASHKYYSILLLMLSKIVIKGINLDSLKGESSHIKTLAEFIRLYNNFNLNIFQDDFSDLKEYRLIADYSITSITEKQYIDINDKYKNLEKIIKNV